MADVVKPNLSEWEAEPTSLRRAYNAVAAIDAFAAHIYQVARNTSHPLGSAEHDLAFRNALALEDNSFRIVRDIAKAQKHVELVRGTANLTVVRASDVHVSPVSYGRGKYGRGKYGGPPQVLVQLTSGSWDYVSSLANEALAFLVQKLAEIAESK